MPNSQQLSVRIARVSPTAEDIPVPHYATEHSAGMDIHAAVQSEVSIAPGERALIPSGFCIEVPPGYEAQVRPRSGLALKHGVTVLNAPGTIDADYRGEVGVILINHGSQPFVIKRGDRIAQLVVAPHERVQWQTVAELGATARGEGGFGHTGITNSELRKSNT